MKIAFLIHSFSAGGAEKQFNLLSQMLTKKGIDNIFITYKNDEPFYKVNNIIIKYIPKKYKIDLFFLYSLVKIVKREKITILFSCYEGHFEAPMLWARLVKIFNSNIKVISGYRALRHKKSLLLLEKITDRLNDLIISNNPNTAALLSNKGKISKDKIKFIPNILDRKNFDSLSSERINELRNKNFPGKNNKFIFGVIARYVPQKNQKIIVEAANILKNNGQLEDYFFSFCGDKSSYKSQYFNIKSMIIKFDLNYHFELNGPRKEVNHFLNACDAIILPSLYEGFSNVVSEAIMCKKPVIISTSANEAKLVKNGVNGLIFNPNNAKELADCILKLKKKEMIISTEFVNTFLNLYSPNRVVTEYEKLFNSIL